MRLALISDIHGNPLAFDAVLRDIQAAGGVETYLFLGDYSALGYDPVTPLERIAALPHAVCVRGNTDRYTTTGARPGPSEERARLDPALIPAIVEIAGSFAWTLGYITAAGWLGWLDALPLDHRLTLPDGTRLLAVHAAPGTDDGPGINPAMSDDEVRDRFGGCDADLVVVGHTHYPQDRALDGLRVVNTGSISNPIGNDLRASYVLLTADASGYALDFRRVDYDRQAAIEAVRRVRHPAAEHILRYLEGRIRPDWLDALDTEK